MKNKKKLIINIKNLNKILKFNAYLMVFLNKYYCRNYKRIIYFNNELREFFY